MRPARDVGIGARVHELDLLRVELVAVDRQGLCLDLRDVGFALAVDGAGEHGECAGQARVGRRGCAQTPTPEGSAERGREGGGLRGTQAGLTRQTLLVLHRAELAEVRREMGQALLAAGGEHVTLLSSQPYN